MQTRFLTSLTCRFNPFHRSSKPIRLFLSLIPPSARQSGLKLSTTLLPRTSREPPSLEVVFKDGKSLHLDAHTMKLADMAEEVDRHSRTLHRREALSSS